MKRFTSILLLTVCVLAVHAGKLDAGLILRITTDAGSQSYMDTLGTGILSTSDPIGGLAFNVNVATSKPNAPNNGNTIADVSLMSVSVFNSGIADLTFTIEVTDTDFELPRLGDLGHARLQSDLRILQSGGEVDYQSFMSTGNTEFDKTDISGVVLTSDENLFHRLFRLQR